MRLRAARRLRSSLQPLLAHKVRTVLALSGVAVGVAAVVVASAIGQGAQLEVLRTIESAGTNLLIVKPTEVKRLVARRSVTGLARTLAVGDYEAILELECIAAAAPALEGSVTVKASTIAMKTTVRGTTAAFPVVRRFRVASGRFFDEDDNTAARRLAVVGARVAEKVFENRDVVGQEIRIRGVPFEVIGVLEGKGTTADGADQDNQVLVPIQTALRRIFNATWLSAVYVSIGDPERMDDAAAEIQRLLAARHQRRPDDRPADFAIQNTARIRSVQQEMTQSLSRLSTGLAAMALVVGGIGILALMLLSVRERTAEIGLRMAVGAQPRDILIQFLVEATVLALAGWVGGIALGAVAGVAVIVGTAWTIAVPVAAGLVSLAAAIVIGLGFGALPARAAARIPPIQALLRV